ncbi:MAG: hypothetical protein QXX79_01095 [Candidatus Bathyarchaeia archaeon]
MPRPKLYQDGKAVTFYAEIHVFEKLKQYAEARGSNVSEELNNLMRKRMAEFEGSEASAVTPSKYEAMKREYLKLVEGFTANWLRLHITKN